MGHKRRMKRLNSTIIDEQQPAGPPELRRIRGDVEDWHPLHVGDKEDSASLDISSATNSQRRPLALVYRGIGATNRKGCEDCSEVIAKLLRGSKYHFDVKYVGPNEKLKLSAEMLKSAALYAQPGGDEDVIDAYNALKKAIPAIVNYVRNGGRYLGICMGGFLAPSRWAFNDRADDSSDSPGFGLFPGKADRYIRSPHASVKNENEAAVDLIWRDKPRKMFFQDGPYFRLSENQSGTTILGRYKSNNEIAALVVPYGKGKVGVCGPHPEADKSWLSDVGKMKSAYDLGYDLIDTTMAGWSGVALSVSTNDGTGSTTKTTTAISGSPCK